MLNSCVDRLGFVVVGEWRDRGTTEAIVLVVFCLLFFFWHQFGDPRALQVAVPVCGSDHLYQWNTVPSTAAPSHCFSLYVRHTKRSSVDVQHNWKSVVETCQQ